MLLIGKVAAPAEGAQQSSAARRTFLILSLPSLVRAAQASVFVQSMTATARGDALISSEKIFSLLSPNCPGGVELESSFKNPVRWDARAHTAF